MEKLDVPEINSLLLSNAEHKSISNILEHLTVLESVNKKLQATDATMVDVRALFDAGIEKYPSMDVRLSPTAKIVICPNFESAVNKLQENRCYDLTESEPNSVRSLLHCADEESVGDDSSLSFAQSVFKKRQMETTAEGIGYVNTSILLPTSNIVERLFSRVGWILNDRKSCVTPEHFE